jgi:hypothetical protein
MNVSPRASVSPNELVEWPRPSKSAAINIARNHTCAAGVGAVVVSHVGTVRTERCGWGWLARTQDPRCGSAT